MFRSTIYIAIFLTALGAHAASGPRLEGHIASPTAVTLKWYVDDPQGIVVIQRSMDTYDYVNVASLSGRAQAYTDFGLSSHATYYYRINFVDSQGNEQQSNVIDLTPMAPPPQPKDVSIELINAGVKIDWSIQLDSQGYTILRASTPEGPFYEAGNSPASQFVDKNVTRMATYYYMVIAINPAGESKPSEVVGITIP